MATIIDALVVTLGLDSKGFRKGAADAKAATDDLKKSTVNNATQTERVAKSGMTLAAKVAKAKKTEYDLEVKRGKQQDYDKKRRATLDKKYTDQTIAGLKSLASFAAVAVLGFDSLKGALNVYAGTVGQLAGLGRLAPTIGVDPKQLNTLGNFYKQFGGTQENASTDIGAIAQSQFHRQMGIPDTLMAAANRIGVGMINAQGQNLNPLQVLNQIRDALRRMAPGNITAQSMYARQMGLSEGFIKSELLPSDQQRRGAMTEAQATANATAANTAAAENLTTAISGLTNTINGIWQNIVGKTAPWLAKTINDVSGGHGGAVAGDLAKGLWNWNKSFYGGTAQSIGALFHSRGPHATERQNAAFAAAEKKYGLPRGFLSGIAEKESSYNPNAVNKKTGARGLMGLMPKWFPNAGKNANADIDAAAAELARLLKAYKGNVTLALQAYNDGQGNVNKSLRGKHALPAETQAYPTQVLKAAAAANFAANASAPAATSSALTASTGGGPSQVVDIDNINIFTQATDANGIAAAIPAAIKRKGIVAQANSGMN